MSDKWARSSTALVLDRYEGDADVGDEEKAPREKGSAKFPGTVLTDLQSRLDGHRD